MVEIVFFFFLIFCFLFFVKYQGCESHYHLAGNPLSLFWRFLDEFKQLFSNLIIDLAHQTSFPYLVLPWPLNIDSCHNNTMNAVPLCIVFCKVDGFFFPIVSLKGTRDDEEVSIFLTLQLARVISVCYTPHLQGNNFTCSEKGGVQLINQYR